MKNAISWFEIPVVEFDRAKTFYESVLNAEMPVMEMGEAISAFFPADLQEGIGGCIIKTDGHEPNANGVLVYLNGGDDLDVPLSRVEAAGGKIILPKTSIGENGFMAYFLDTEGNRVAFHSRG
ncbi:MAG: VOC family protein [Schleiferiaceae bacterium]|jgi:predicted enzyme related to lactoylglutathione lyase|nr:VOC family protein [Schleiferiaceae bacterium]